MKLQRVSAPLLATMLLAASCWGDPGVTGPPPIISALVAIYPGGGERPSALVQVLDPTTGAPVPGATVTVNGAAIPYDPASQEFDGTFQVDPGATIALRVFAGGRTYHLDAAAPAVAPTITAPTAGAVWPDGCSNAISWSSSDMPGSPTALVAVLDATDPNAAPLLQEAGAPQLTSVEPGTLGAGPRLVLVAFVTALPIPEADVASSLTLLDTSLVEVSAVAADFREVAVRPANQGVVPGATAHLRAEATRCDVPGATRDVTAEAIWTSSRPEVATVSGAAGAATGVGVGTTTISASASGATGSTLLGVRDFTARASPDTGHQLLAVTWTGTQAVAVGEGGLVLTSPDGAAWSQQVSGSAGLLTSVASSPSRLVVVQYGSPATLTSQDGVRWTAGSLGAAAGAWSVAWTGSQFVAVGPSGAILASQDGLAWTSQASGTTATLMDVTATGPQLVAVGGDGLEVILTSADGASWSDRTPSVGPGTLHGVVYGGGAFVAVGDAGPSTSVDGEAWAAQQGPGYLTGVASSGGEFMAVGYAMATPSAGLTGVVASSTDGQTWLTWSVGSEVLDGVAWTGSRWVLVGNHGTILTSP